MISSTDSVMHGGRETRSVALGDVDGYEDLDLVTGNWDKPNRLYLNTGTADPFSGVSGSNIGADVDATTSIALGNVGGEETLDARNNKLDQIYGGDSNCDGSDNCYDRLDYVYVKSTGDGFMMVPTSATVLRDWKNGSNMDLSDHYPLLVTFEFIKNNYIPLVLKN